MQPLERMLGNERVIVHHIERADGTHGFTNWAGLRRPDAEILEFESVAPQPTMTARIRAKE